MFAEPLQFDTPIQTLNAPWIPDDPYADLLSWSPKTNKILIGGKTDHKKTALPTVQLIDPELKQNEGTTIFVKAANSNDIKAVRWSPDGIKFSIGDSTGKLEVWDSQRQDRIVSFDETGKREGVHAWNGDILIKSFGNGGILQRDFRNRVVSHTYGRLADEPVQNNYLMNLKWSEDQFRFVSSSSRGVVKVYDVRNPVTPLYSNTQESTITIKAIDWSPSDPNVLIMGLRNSHSFIDKIDITQGERVGRVEVMKGQPINLITLRNSNLFMVALSSCDYAKKNIAVYNCDDLSMVGHCFGHKREAFSLDQSPDGKKILTGGGRSCKLMLWDIATLIEREE